MFCPAPILRLIALTGPDRGRICDLGEGIYSFGRAPDNSVVLHDDSVSRCHALVVCASGRCRIEDLGSANGTFHNDLRVAISPLQPGDRLAIGETEFRVERVRSPAAVRFAADLFWLLRGRVPQRPRPISPEILSAMGETGEPILRVDTRQRPRAEAALP